MHGTEAMICRYTYLYDESVGDNDGGEQRRRFEELQVAKVSACETRRRLHTIPDATSLKVERQRLADPPADQHKKRYHKERNLHG
jgi:hypothetical protein